MIPSYCAIGIFFGIFWGVCVLCLRSGRLSFSRAELLVFYLFSRIVPVFMQEHIAARSLLCLLLEWILIGVLTAVCRKKRSSWTAYARLLPVSTGFDILYSGRNGFRSVSGFPVFYGSFGIGPSDSSTRRETSELLARISVRLYRNLLYGMVCFAFFRTCIPVIGRRKCSSGRFCSACVLPCMEAGLEP